MTRRTRTVTVPCCGSQHRVVVEGDDLVLLDHDDRDGALDALGADISCFGYQRSWRAQHFDVSLEMVRGERCRAHRNLWTSVAGERRAQRFELLPSVLLHEGLARIGVPWEQALESAVHDRWAEVASANGFAYVPMLRVQHGEPALDVTWTLDHCDVVLVARPAWADLHGADLYTTDDGVVLGRTFDDEWASVSVTWDAEARRPRVRLVRTALPPAAPRL